MPASMQDSELDGLLKSVYSNFREKVFPITNVLMAQLKKGTPGGPRNMRWGGRGVIADVVLTRPVGMVASDTGFLGTHSQAVERQITMGIRRLYVTREIDGLSIVGTATKEQAFISIAKKILEEAKDACKLGLQEVLHGDGRGIKALVNSVTNTTTVVSAAPYGIAGAGQGGLLLDVGMRIAILNPAGTVERGQATITSVTNNGDLATVVYSPAISGVVANDIIVAATSSTHSFNQYPTGLSAILNRGGAYNVLHGLDAGQFSRWNTIRHTAGVDTPDVDAPSESDIWDIITRVAGVSGKDANSSPGEFLLMGTKGLERKLAEQFYGQRRLAPTDFQNLKGGFKAVTICGLPFVSDTWAPAGSISLLHLPSLTWVDAKDWGAVQYESSPAWRPISGRDAHQTSFSAYLEFGTLARNAHGLISGYTDTQRYSHVQ